MSQSFGKSFLGGLQEISRDVDSFEFRKAEVPKSDMKPVKPLSEATTGVEMSWNDFLKNAKEELVFTTSEKEHILSFCLSSQMEKEKVCLISIFDIFF